MLTSAISLLNLISTPQVHAHEMIDNFVDNNGVQIHYLQKKHPNTENQPAILFVPGLLMPAWIWEKQLDYFSKDYTVVAMDPRSQGESSLTSERQYQAGRAEDIKAVIDQLELKPVVLVGWSLAVSEVVAYLSQYGSDNIAKVVLVDGFAGAYPDAPYLDKMIDDWSNFQINRIAKTPDVIKGMFLQPQNEEYLKKLTLASLRMPTTTMMALIYNFILLDYRPTLPSIKVPTLVITTAKAPWLEDMKRLQSMIPYSQFEIISDAGHAVFVDQPKQFNEVLEKFLNRNDS